MMAGKRPVVAKGEVLKLEHAHAEHIDDKLKNPDYGFKCLHYSVSESSGSLKVHIEKKTSGPGEIRAATIDAEAKAGEDYEQVDTVLKFSGKETKFIEIKIFDDDNWEPDEDFFVQLFDPSTNEELTGQDAKTRITIIDDDKPGQICFQESGTTKAVATEEFAEIVIVRKHGSDGVVTVDYETQELGKSEHTATPKVDYESTSGTLRFETGETSKSIYVKIIPHDDPNEMRDETFGIQLSNVTPEGAKLSKKSFQIVNIITDVEGKKKSEALQQLLKKIEDEEETTWSSQFITACMLHPTKNEDGDIEDISAMDGFLHFSCIGWKLLFSFIPPPHYLGGWGCFIIALVFIGIVTAVVGEFANLFGCVLSIKPAVTAITFVALGTSLPDTFASMAAAKAEKYADSAVGNVTGSNSVNVFLGLGLPWVIGAMYESGTPASEKGYDTSMYFVPAGSLGFSVSLFVVCAILCIITLVIRRFKVGGELGGSQFGRSLSAGFLVFLWFIYIIMSILQAYGVAGLDEVQIGVDTSIKNPNAKCNKA